MVGDNDCLRGKKNNKMAGIVKVTFELRKKHPHAAFHRYDYPYPMGAFVYSAMNKNNSLQASLFHESKEASQWCFSEPKHIVGVQKNNKEYVLSKKALFETTFRFNDQDIFELFLSKCKGSYLSINGFDFYAKYVEVADTSTMFRRNKIYTAVFRPNFYGIHLYSSEMQGIHPVRTTTIYEKELAESIFRKCQQYPKSVRLIIDEPIFVAKYALKKESKEIMKFHNFSLSIVGDSTVMDSCYFAGIGNSTAMGNGYLALKDSR